MQTALLRVSERLTLSGEFQRSTQATTKPKPKRCRYAVYRSNQAKPLLPTTLSEAQMRNAHLFAVISLTRCNFVKGRNWDLTVNSKHFVKEVIYTFLTSADITELLPNVNSLQKRFAPLV